MKKGLTELVFILDKSGSMDHLTDDTIGGFNSMIEQQKQEDGEAYVTTVLFSSFSQVLHDHVNIQDVQPITKKDYVPMGMTALLDAVGNTINSIGQRLSDTPEDERPEKVIFVITTDGMENSSHEYTRSQIKAAIEHQQDKYSWVFMFLGANIDAVSEGSSLGIKSGYSKTYTASGIGTQSVYKSASSVLSCARGYSNSLESEEFDKVVTACLDSIV